MTRTLIALIALIALIPHASAEPIKAGNELNDYVTAVQDKLEQPRSNLLSMSGGLPELEAGYAMNIYDAATSADEKISQLFVATKIYTMMVDNRDRATVRSVVNLQASQTIKRLDLHLNTINKSIVKLRAPAAVTEAQQIRNALVEARDGLQKRTPL